jgi:hypothetical protein
MRASHSAISYTVCQLPSIKQQFGSSSREAAIRLARGFAQKHAVDLWYSDAGAYRLLEAYRPTVSRTPLDDQGDDKIDMV